VVAGIDVEHFVPAERACVFDSKPSRNAHGSKDMSTWELYWNIGILSRDGRIVSVVADAAALGGIHIYRP
jgi:hypothetical protein